MRGVDPGLRRSFQAGSISKPTFALGLMRLVQDGRLDLDEDVNLTLTSWKVPENRFTANEKVTLRRILSHNASLTVHGFPGYQAGTPVPTVVQLLNGTKPANTAAVRVDTFPGAISRSSGGGTTVAQLLTSTVGRDAGSLREEPGGQGLRAHRRGPDPGEEGELSRWRCRRASGVPAIQMGYSLATISEY